MSQDNSKKRSITYLRGRQRAALLGFGLTSRMSSAKGPELIPPKNTDTFKAWLSAQGPIAGFHPDVDYVSGRSLPRRTLRKRSLVVTDHDGGHALHAIAIVPPHSIIVTLPFSHAITPTIGHQALCAVSTEPAALDSLSERQLVCIYLCAHWALGLASFDGSPVAPMYGGASIHVISTLMTS
jgi:hypothetical protein